MNAVLRATAILIDPFAEWARIEKEADDPIHLMTRYVALLALVPALFGFLGASVIGATVPGGAVVRTGLFDGFFGAIFGYLEALATMLLLGLFIELLMPLFQCRKDFAGALRLAAYSYTPVWLTGVFLLLPGLRFLTLTAFYGGYILMAGVLRTMKLPRQKSVAFAAIVVTCACALALGAGAAQHMLFPGAGGM